MIETDFHRREFADGEELALGLADWTAERLRGAIAARGVALLIVSGGKSPARFFDLLSNLDLDWTRVAITLADERRVADDSPRSNARLVRERLLRNRAEAASFTPLADVRLPEDQELAAASARIANLPMPADVVVLGMGDDGHTASWFPGADGLAEAMDPAARQLVAPIVAPDAPEPRLTLTGRVILRARAIALEIQGEAKLATFAAALEPGPEEAMPIRAVLRGAADRLTVFMCFANGPLPPIQRPKSVLRRDRRRCALGLVRRWRVSVSHGADAILGRHSAPASQGTNILPRAVDGNASFSRRFIGCELAVGDSFPSVLVVQDNDDREQRKDQHVIFPLRQDKSVRGERDEAAGQRAGHRARFRHVGEIAPQAVPDRKQEQPGEKDKSGDPRLDEQATARSCRLNFG